MNESGSNLEATPCNTSTMTNHYVTITGVLNDRRTGAAWLRIQTWGRARYINYDEFYEYRSPVYPISTAMGSIIVLE